jgi:hypothetical protein
MSFSEEIAIPEATCCSSIPRLYPVDATQVTDGGKIIRVMGSIGTAAKNSVVTLD